MIVFILYAIPHKKAWESIPQGYLCKTNIPLLALPLHLASE